MRHMYYLYVIQHSETQEVYIGKTNDLKRRLKEHNAGEQIATHRISGEWKVVYTEVYRAKSDADKRELRLKQHGRAKQELLKRLKSSLFF